MSSRVRDLGQRGSSAARGFLARAARNLRPALILFAIFTLVAGIFYPLLVTGIAQIAFPHQANGSQIIEGGKVVGSELIGQPFSDPKYFWGRPSATTPFEYNASLSTGSNLGPSNPALKERVQARIDALHAVDPNNTQPIPSDLVTASGSGLDPDISVAAALYQLPRVARERGMSEDQVRTLIDQNTQGRGVGFLGEERVNVLELNLALDRGAPSESTAASAPSKGTNFLGLTTFDLFFLGAFLIILIALVRPLGGLFANIYLGEKSLLSPIISPAENRLLSFSGKAARKEMDWKEYALAVLIFNGIGIAFLFILLSVQSALPLNPLGWPSLPPGLAFNTAVSFGSNTNWQAYAGETTMSHFSQMVGLTVQNFLSASTGIAVLIAIIRGIKRHTTRNLGNFWSDLIKAVLILLPLALILSIVLVSQGTPQTLNGSFTVPLLQPSMDSNGVNITSQIIPVGPVASQEAIKMLGTNGGGFFNTNSAHPFENPTPLSNFLETLSILLIPAALCYTYGRMVGDTRQGWAILAAMLIIFLLFLAFTIWAEGAGNPVLANLGVDQSNSLIHPGGNMEGKEVRFGQVPSDLFAVSTSAASNGAVNSMHDSYTPLGGMAPLLLIDLGEVVFGGVGSGLYGMLVFVIIATFVAGLMTGRTPEYLGKKIAARETRTSIAVILLPTLLIMVGTAIALSLPEGRSSIFNPGPHGFTEVLYAFSSAANNNGSAFAGLMANTAFYNFSLGLAMLLGRFGTIVLILFLAGSLAAKKTVPPSSGTLPTHTPLFIIWLVGVVILVGALSFFTALALGPIVEHLMLYGGL